MKREMSKKQLDIQIWTSEKRPVLPNRNVTSHISIFLVATVLKSRS